MSARNISKTAVGRALLGGRRIAPSHLGGGEPRGAPMPIGRAGIPIPNPRALYRTTIDGTLLTGIVKAAYAAWSAEHLPQAWWDNTADTLALALGRRFPAADMAVLTRYGFTQPTNWAIVDVRADVYRSPVRLKFAAPRNLPGRAACFAVDLLEQERPSADPQVPADAISFFEQWLALERAKQPQFFDAVKWPGWFHTQEGRWPRWFEIEAAWPPLGTWLKEQRS